MTCFTSRVCVCVCLAINGFKILHRQQLRFLLSKIVVIVIVIAFVNAAAAAVVAIVTGTKCIDLRCVLVVEKVSPLSAKVCYDFA